MGSGLKHHEALEALEKNGIRPVLQIGGHPRADSIVANHQSLGELLVEGVGVSPQRPQKFENCHLEEGILDASDLILSVVLLGDESVGPCDFGHEFDELWCQGLIEGDGVFEEGHAAEQDSVAFLFQAVGDLGQKFRDVLGHPLDDLDGGEDGLLANVGRVAADALRVLGYTLRTSKWRSRASSGVQISERTQRVSETMLLLFPLRSILMRLVAIISSSDFSWKSWVNPG